MDPFVLLAVAEGCGPGIVGSLLSPDVDPARVLEAPGEDLAPRIRARLLDRAGLEADANRWLSAAARLGFEALTPRDPRYPDALRDAPARPALLFARGELALLDASHHALAIVGSRTPTAYGLAATEDFARAVAETGTPIWSGLAAGVDATAHRACLRVGTPTIAVLAGGLDHVYPASHRGLFDAIVDAGGLCVSEAPPGMRPTRGHFPRRNRVIALATGAVLVVEAGLASGSLHTARWAAETGVPVFAVPGPYTSERSRGCHRLLADGAFVAADPESLLRDLGVQAATSDLDDANRRAVDADERAILDVIALGPRPCDLVRRESRLDDSRFYGALLRLCERGAARQIPGDLIAVSGRA